jgi:hypothetical protein
MCGNTMVDPFPGQQMGCRCGGTHLYESVVEEVVLKQGPCFEQFPVTPIDEDEIARNDLKWDNGKLKFSLILPEFEKLMAEILTKGEINHPRVAGEPSWQQVEPEAYINAMKRHISSFQLGESTDSDMNTHHMGHVAINAMFLYWLDTGGKSNDS